LPSQTCSINVVRAANFNPALNPTLIATQGNQERKSDNAMTISSRPALQEKLHRLQSYLQTFTSISNLVETYLCESKLRDRLADLPVQFENPQPRPWAPIDWQALDRSQIVGVSPEVFLSVIVGSMEVEAPIRGYATVSFRYLEKLHPKMARFVGGTFAEDGSLIEPGLWEKEERQHAPTLAKIYRLLTGEKLRIKPSGVKRYVPSDNPREDLYGHGLHRIATEYGATCLYIWLMAHSTGALQQVFSELVVDEVNHMTKFWGFGLWAFPESLITRIRLTIAHLINRTPHSRFDSSDNQKTQANYLRSVVELFQTFGRVMGLVAWNSWPLNTKLELIFTFVQVMHRVRRWQSSLTQSYLQQLLGVSPCVGQRLQLADSFQNLK
jgi:hypothetical protein